MEGNSNNPFLLTSRRRETHMEGNSNNPFLLTPELRIEQFRIQLNFSTNLGVLFGGDNLAVDHEDHFRRDPTAAKFLILVELGLLRLRSAK